MEMGIAADGLGGLWVVLHSLNFFRNFGRSLPTEIREVKFSDFGPKKRVSERETERARANICLSQPGSQPASQLGRIGPIELHKRRS